MEATSLQDHGGNSMPLMSAPVDQIRFGLQTPLAAETKMGHPLERSLKRDEFSVKCDMVKRMYGTAAALRLKSERRAAIGVQRFPSLKSSFVALETILGEDETISFEDVLNDPFESETEPTFKVHEAMEIKLGL